MRNSILHLSNFTRQLARPFKELLKLSKFKLVQHSVILNYINVLCSAEDYNRERTNIII